MDYETIEQNESSVRGYSRSFPVIFHKASQSTIYDLSGRKYIDFLSGAGGLNYGHNHPVIKKALLAYLEDDGIIHGLDMATQAKIAFITTFKDTILTPRGLDYRLQFTGPTGANAVEAALKLARLVTKRSGIIAFTHAFHGVSIGALATTANAWYRDAAGVELSNVTFLPYDGYIESIDSIAYLEKILDDPGSGQSIPAAVIVETIQGEGGINVASAEWLQRLRELTARHGILLIVDDIQAGCGRSGDFFSFEEAGIVPDLITLSKSISGSGLPMSLLLIKPEYDIWQPGQHNGTFRGNNLAFISAKAALQEFWVDESFSSEVKRKGLIIKEQLLSIADDSKNLKLTVRGRGMLYGLVFDKDPAQAKQVAKDCFEKGLIIEVSGSNGEVLKLLPALTTNDDELHEGLSIIRDSIKLNSNQPGIT